MGEELPTSPSPSLCARSSEVVLPCEYLIHCSSAKWFLQDPEDMDLGPLSFVYILKQREKRVTPSEPAEVRSGKYGYTPPV